MTHSPDLFELSAEIFHFFLQISDRVSFSCSIRVFLYAKIVSDSGP